MGGRVAGAAGGWESRESELWGVSPGGVAEPGRQARGVGEPGGSCGEESRAGQAWLAGTQVLPSQCCQARLSWLPFISCQVSAGQQDKLAKPGWLCAPLHEGERVKQPSLAGLIISE